MAIPLAALAVLVGCGGGGTQSVTLRGVVRSATGGSLPSLTVVTAGATAPVQSDGSFVLTGVATGQQVVEVRNTAGTALATASVNVVGDATLQPIDVWPSGSGTGIKGVVLRGPLHPVSTPGVPDYEPVPGAMLDLTNADKSMVLQRITADDQGAFSVDVAAGSYWLVPVIPNAGLFPRGEPVAVKVYAGQYTEVQVIYDTGIR